jgi:undecaprenyl phosphate-alpha-L-ara4N flippase subunit ArnE
MRESFERNKKGIALMLAASLCACVGQLLWKLAAEKGILFMLAGFCVYGIGALLMLYAYRFGKLSVLQPMLSMSYVLSIVLAAMILKESVTVLKCAAIAVIIAGVVLVAGGDAE